MTLRGCTQGGTTDVLTDVGQNSGTVLMVGADVASSRLSLSPVCRVLTHGTCLVFWSGRTALRFKGCVGGRSARGVSGGVVDDLRGMS